MNQTKLISMGMQYYKLGENYPLLSPSVAHDFYTFFDASIDDEVTRPKPAFSEPLALPQLSSQLNFPFKRTL